MRESQKGKSFDGMCEQNFKMFGGGGELWKMQNIKV